MSSKSAIARFIGSFISFSFLVKTILSSILLSDSSSKSANPAVSSDKSATDLPFFNEALDIFLLIIFLLIIFDKDKMIYTS